MKRPALLQHIVIALLLTMLAGFSGLLLVQFLSTAMSIRLSSSLIVTVYLCIVLYQSKLAAGKVVLSLVNMLVLTLALFLFEQFSSLFVFSVILIWLNRALTAYGKLSAVMLDFVLCVLSISLFFWVLQSSHSILLSCWSWLLIQALHSLIPGRKINPEQVKTDDHADFEQAYKSAEHALQQLATKSGG